jgi:hypothetical protein
MMAEKYMDSNQNYKPSNSPPYTYNKLNELNLYMYLTDNQTYRGFRYFNKNKYTTAVRPLYLTMMAVLTSFTEHNYKKKHQNNSYVIQNLLKHERNFIKCNFIYISMYY